MSQTKHVHLMKLYDNPFDLMKNGKKTIEVRCNDEKRQQLRIGDTIVFCRFSNSSERITVQVTDLRRFDSFKELYTSLPSERFGMEETDIDTILSTVYSIYTKEEEATYGALAIFVKVL